MYISIVQMQKKTQGGPRPLFPKIANLHIPAMDGSGEQ